MIANVQVETDLWFAHSLQQGFGFTWTLASRLGHIIRTAEGLYGERGRSYTILGVEFGGAVPQVWFPGACGHIIIQITPECAVDMSRACYQMAHEAIHLLSPTGGAHANTFEEGLAAHFSARYVQEHLNANWHAGASPYQAACQLIDQLHAIDPDAIRKLRQVHHLYISSHPSKFSPSVQMRPQS
jgi:hypothetical protein